jgi:hypothetical protein
MTREERALALQYREEGCTWQEISELLGYSEGAVYKDLERVIHAPVKRPQIVFPALTRWVLGNCSGSIIELSRQSGIEKHRLYDICKGRLPPRIEEKETLAALTGISMDELFEVNLDGID